MLLLGIVVGAPEVTVGNPVNESVNESVLKIVETPGGPGVDDIPVPAPPSAKLESCAKPIDGGVARKTEYTFF